MRFNHLLHLIATLAPRLDRGDSLGRRMGDLRHPVSLQCNQDAGFPCAFQALRPISVHTYPCQRRLSEEQEAASIEMVVTGVSQRRVARSFGVSPATVRRTVKRE